VEGLPLARSATGELIEIKDLDDAEACRIAYVSGDRKREGIFPNLSIFENLLIPLYRKHVENGRLGVIDWADLSGIFDWQVERLSIKVGHKSNKITSLSGGNQQKVLIGRSFAQQPNILVLNDPARGIDVETKSELYNHLRDFASRGHSIVFMSSELEEFIGLCSRVVVFRHGSIFDSFPGDSLDPDRILEAMFGQTAGLGAAQHRRADETGRIGSRVVSLEGERQRLQTKVRVGHVKVVDYDEDQGLARDGHQAEAGPRHMKVVYFDD
jgi:ribose transport system ATP-binding protein